MSTSPNLTLPYIVAGQAQKHITVNENLRRLDAVIQLSVISAGITTPPSAPQDGERYIIPTTATGDWAELGNQIAAWQDGAWTIIQPRTGWLAWVEASNEVLVFSASEWRPLSVSSTGSGDGTGREEISINPAERVGINTTADLTNRLSVKSDGVLMSHDDVTPGSGDMRLVLNKASAANTGSLLFQTNWSGRVEMGCTGNDRLAIRTSADGANWSTALEVDSETGQVAMPLSPPVATPFNLFKDAGRFGANPEAQSTSVGTFAAPAYIRPFNGAQISQGPQFYHDNASYGGADSALDPEIDALISRIKSDTNPAYRRYGIEFHALDVTAGSGTGGGLNVDGQNHYLALSNLSAPIPPQLTLNVHLRVLSGHLTLPTAGAGTELFIDGQRQSTTYSLNTNSGWRQITRRYAFPVETFNGYQANLFRIYATPGTRFLLATPSLTPGFAPVSPGQFYLVVPSLEAWR